MRLSWLTNQRVLLVLPLAALLFDLLFLFALPDRMLGSQQSDYHWYAAAAAQNLLAGNGFLDTFGNFLVRIPPGFSIILLPVYSIGRILGLSDMMAVVFLLNPLMAALDVLLLLLIGRMVLPVRVHWLPAVLWISYPIFLWMTKHPASENPFITLLLATAYFLLRAVQADRKFWLWSFGAGIALGCALLIRPIGLPIPLALTVVIPLLVSPFTNGFRRKMLFILSLWLGLALPVTPWMILGSQKAGRFILLSTADISSMWDGLTRGLREGSTGVALPEDVVELTAELKQLQPEIQTSGQFLGMLMRASLEHPVVMGKFFAIKLARSWYGTDMQPERIEWGILVIQVPYLFLGVFGFRRAFRLPGDARNIAILFAAFLLSLWAMALLVVPLIRYLLPALPLLMVLVSLSLEPWASRAVEAVEKRGRQRS